MKQKTTLTAASSGSVEENFYPPFLAPAARIRRFPFMLPRFLRNPLLCMPSAAYEEPIVVVPAPPLRAYVCDPDLVKTVLLEKQEIFPKTAVLRRILSPLLGRGILLSEGDEWRWQRQIVAPLFRQSEILDYVTIMAKAAETQVNKWRTTGLDKIHMIDRDMSEATYEAISNTILSGGGDEIGRAMREDAGDYIAGMPWRLAYAVLDVPEWVPRPRKGRMRRREQRLRGAVYELVRRRRVANDRSDDLLARLIAARRLDSGAAMSDEEMVDMLLTFLTAGHDTTAKALTWSLYLLSHSREWEERIVREIADVVPTGTIESHHIDELTTVSQVIKETLRLYPPAPETTRIASINTELGGIPIKAGTIIDIPIYVIHRHRALWRDPNRFDPNRFSLKEEAGRSRYAFMPFGTGPRVCIGASFALVEAVVLLVSFLREFRFRCPDGFEPVPVSRITLGSRNGMPMVLAERRQC